MILPSRLPVFPLLFWLGASSLAAQAGPVLYRVDGQNQGQQLGSVIASCADLDGDGVRDLIMGAVGSGFERVRVVSGASGATLFSWTNGSVATGRFILDVGDAGDVDADGITDLLVLGADSLGGSPFRLGTLWVRSGATGVVLYRFDTPTGLFGGDVGGLGDVNADGHADFFLAVGLVPSGYVDVISGRDGATLFRLNGTEPGFGESAAAIGDVDGDKIMDLAVGTPFAAGTGAVQLYSSGSGAVVRTILGTTAGSAFGSRVRSAGDVDGDGGGDLLVWERGLRGLVVHGLVHVISGARGDVLQSFPGYDPWELFGHSFAAAGDVDGDGFDDVIIGVDYRNDPTGRQSGTGYVYSGGTGRLLHFFTTVDRQDDLGQAVAGMGDVDGDGTPDLAVSAPLGSQGTTLYSGSVYVFSGRRQGLVLDLVDFAGGAQTTLRLDGGTPANMGAFLMSLTGPGPIPTPFGLLSLGPPLFVLGALPFDAQGTAELRFPVPAALSGVYLNVQAAEVAGLPSPSVQFSPPRPAVII